VHVVVLGFDAVCSCRYQRLGNTQSLHLLYLPGVHAERLSVGTVKPGPDLRILSQSSSECAGLAFVVAVTFAPVRFAGRWDLCHRLFSANVR
jgi:hypothetical protein